VSPKLIDLYREDGIGLDQLMALAVTDDHVAQERVWKACPEWQRTPQRLRQLLTGEEVDAARDPVARFVGVKAFEEAGGFVRRDLFADDDAGHMADIELLHRLALGRLEEAAEPVRHERWSWVEARVAVHAAGRQVQAGDVAAGLPGEVAYRPAHATADVKDHVFGLHGRLCNEPVGCGVPP
jgi:ParB family chromosome partitioning protein